MPRIPGFDALGTKAKGAAIAIAGRLTVDGLADRKYTSLIHPKYATLVVCDTGLVAKRAQNGIIKGLGFFEIIGTEHYMTKHLVFLIYWLFFTKEADH